VQYQVERTPEGHFVKGQSGNPAGKPPGRCSHTSRTAEILLDGEVEALARTAMARALEDSRIIAPRRPPVHLDLPPTAGPARIAATMAAVAAAVAGGVITTGEGAEVTKVVDTHVWAMLPVLSAGKARDTGSGKTARSPGAALRRCTAPEPRSR